MSGQQGSDNLWMRFASQDDRLEWTPLGWRWTKKEIG